MPAASCREFRLFHSRPAHDARQAFHNNRIIGPILEWLKYGEPLYTLLYCLGIIFFAYFYISIVFNPNEVADNMRKWGGFIPASGPASAPPTLLTKF